MERSILKRKSRKSPGEAELDALEIVIHEPQNASVTGIGRNQREGYAHLVIKKFLRLGWIEPRPHEGPVIKTNPQLYQITDRGICHCIAEKSDWDLPKLTQLAQHSDRPKLQPHQRLLFLTLRDSPKQKVREIMKLAEQIQEAESKDTSASSFNEALAFSLLKYGFDHRGEGRKDLTRRPWFNLPMAQAIITLELTDAFPRGLWGYDLNQGLR